MGLRALIGVEDAAGTYRARSVHYDGCPTVIVPVLAALVHDTYQGDVTAAVAHLMHRDWRGLSCLPASLRHPAEVIEVACDQDQPVETGQIATANAGDREWAYLFCGDRLQVHLGVLPERGPARWKRWVHWSVDELPDLTVLELLDVQRSGYAKQWAAADFRTYMALVRERFHQRDQA